MRIHRTGMFLALLAIPALAGPASAQSTLTDARQIAMGGSAGSSTNIALRMVPPSTSASASIPLPLGLIQVFKGGFDKFKPGSDDFDPVRSVELLSNPFAYTFGAESTPRQEFINDLVNGTLNPDITTYVGFKIPETFVAEGLRSPQYGMTFKFAKKEERYHGLYLGAGPYLSFLTEVNVDPRFVDLLNNGTRYPNTTMTVGTDDTEAQGALSLTGGYRGRLALPESMSTGAERDGLYVAYNFNYLRGFRYYDPDLIVRFATNAQGNLTSVPPAQPFNLVTLEAESGTGLAHDFGVQVVRGQFQFGVGINGVGNHINWTDFTQTTYTLPSLTSGFEFTETPNTTTVTERRVTLPVVKTANLGFEGLGWAASGTVSDGYNGKSFHGGVERQVGSLFLRGGAKYTREKWNPTFGFGVGQRIALDVAFFGTHANFEDERKYAVAASIRIGAK